MRLLVRPSLTGFYVTLNATGTGLGAGFDAAVAALNDTLFVGASGAGRGGNTLYVYQVAPETMTSSLWQTILSPVSNSSFGCAVSAAFAGNRSQAAVGAPLAPEGGAVFVYSTRSGVFNFGLQASLAAPANAINFGQAVAIDNTTLIVATGAGLHATRCTDNTEG